ncbi:MAG: hypothetical protein JXA11_15090 [Phycisphaerae bacterium]|nr:hypothetical protein [Phycisphaerae bacterium]
MRFRLCAILMIFPPGYPLHAEEPAKTPPPVTVEYLRNDVYTPEPGYVVVRSAFQVEGPPHRWVALDMEFRLSQAVPLIRPDGKVFMKRWNHLFLPEKPHPARWTDCRLDVDYEELETAKNLPRGKTFVVWVMGVLFDHAVEKHLGASWPTRTPLVLTTDDQGHIQNAYSPVLNSILLDYPSDNTIDARRMKIRTVHLQPKRDVRAYRVSPRGASPETVLTEPEGQIWQPTCFGGAFAPIDSAEKAEELVLLRYPGGVVLRTREQYDAVIDAARKLGWKPEYFPQADPEFPGFRITPIEGLGWRVEALLIEPRGEGLGDVAALDYTIATDGREGLKRKVLLPGPGGEKQIPVRADVYTTVVQSNLAGKGLEIISPRFQTTETIVKLSVPLDTPPEKFLSLTEPKTVTKDSSPAPKPPVQTPTTTPAPPATKPNPTTVPATRLTDPTVPPETITTPGPTPIRKSRK